jgi:hypothetical protein
MAFVLTTTTTASYQLLTGRFKSDLMNGWAASDWIRCLTSGLNIFFTLFMLGCLLIILGNALGTWIDTWRRVQRG